MATTQPASWGHAYDRCNRTAGKGVGRQRVDGGWELVRVPQRTLERPQLEQATVGTPIRILVYVFF